MELSKKTKSAFLICFLEGWERFSYYGMRALLVLYLTSKLGFNDVKAYSVYSLFAAIGYSVPVLAGFLADRMLGFQRTLIIGGFILCLGHLAMALTSDDPTLVYVGLSLITIGTGFFKGNVTSLLGTIYSPLDPQRDKAFTWFYVSVNIGGAIAAIICGFVAKAYGWHYGFGLAGLGMLLGLIIFLGFRYLLGENGRNPNVINFKRYKLPVLKSLIIAAAICFLSFLMISNSEAATPYFTKVGLLVLLILVVTFVKHSPEERKDMAVLCILTFFTMLFYAVEMHLGSFINLFTERNVNRVLFGFEIPTASLQSINPISIILLGSIFAGIFVKRGQNWNMKRFALGLTTNTLCFAVIYWGCLNAVDGSVSIVYLISGMLLMGFSEIAIAPVIQSLITILSPAGVRGLMMGFLMFALSYSNLIGLFVGKFMAVPKEEIGNKMLSLNIYQKGFLSIMAFSALVVVLFSMCIPWLTKRIQNIKN
jgi:POT family proton-dependent oligopeptide transporter